MFIDSNKLNKLISNKDFTCILSFAPVLRLTLILNFILASIFALAIILVIITGNLTLYKV